jgi:hypothetical protein
LITDKTLRRGCGSVRNPFLFFRGRVPGRTLYALFFY